MLTSMRSIRNARPTTVTPNEILAKGADKRMTVQQNLAAAAVTTYNGTASWTRAGNAQRSIFDLTRRSGEARERGIVPASIQNSF